MRKNIKFILFNSIIFTICFSFIALLRTNGSIFDPFFIMISLGCFVVIFMITSTIFYLMKRFSKKTDSKIRSDIEKVLKATRGSQITK